MCFQPNLKYFFISIFSVLFILNSGIVFAATCDGEPEGTPCAFPGSECVIAACDEMGQCIVSHPLPFGDPCGDHGIECSQDDYCDGMGQCIDSGFVEVGTACGTQGVECSEDDACDGSGQCIDYGFAAVGTACGSTTDTSCTDPDSCDGAGSCSDNHEMAGVACGDDSDTLCTDPDSCDGTGTCSGNHEIVGIACGDPGTDSCDSSGVCSYCSHLSLPPLVIDRSAETRFACIDIEASSDFTVLWPAEVVFEVINSAMLGSGFQIENGAKFDVIIVE